LVVPTSVRSELIRLSARGVPGAQAALALSERFSPIEARSRGDAALVELAFRRGAAVVTADRALADRLQSQGVSVLVPRDRQRLELHPGRSLEVPRPGARPRSGPLSRRQRL